jgi:MFS family permease
MRRLFALVATVLLVDTMFLAALAPLLPSYVDDLGISKSAAGVLSASYPAGTLLASLPSGLVAARIGARPTMLVGLGLLGLSSIAFAFGDTIVVLDLARFAQGVGGAFSWTAGLAWLIGAAPRDRRGELIGSAMAAAVTGLLLGPVLGSVATATSPEAVFTGVAVLAAALIAWTLATPRPTPAPGRPLREASGAILTAPILVGFWLVAVPSVLAGAIEVLAPLRLDELGASGTAIGAIFLVSAAVEAAISPAVGRLSDRRGRLQMVRAGLLAATGAALLLPLPVTVALLAIVVVIVFLALTLTWTPSMALLSERTESAGVDLAFGTALLSLAWAGGQVLGGSAMSGLADATSDAVAYASIALLLGLTVAAIGLPGRRRSS